MRPLILAGLIVAGCALPVTAAPAVVATVKPIHALVAAVMEGVGTPDLIVKGGASAHTYSLKPSDARALAGADVVFWSGHGMEVFLEDSIDTLAPDAAIFALSEAPGIELLPVREGGAFEAHDHGDHDDHEGHDHEGEHDQEGHSHEDEGDDHGHAHGAGDMHYWLDPANARILVGAIAEALAAADAENADAYAANAATAVQKLDALEAELVATLAPVTDRPFIVFHDAYQYFERRFGLSMAGTITVSPDTMPGAQRVSELRSRLASLDAACIFAEPQFEPAIVATIAEGTGAAVGTLDPEGAGLTEGPELYAELLRGLAASLVSCLEN